MENNFSAKSSLGAAGIAGYASPLLLGIAVLGLCCALFLLALPGVAGELGAPEQNSPAPSPTSAIPLTVSLSTADQHLQIAESFNAALDRSTAQAASQRELVAAYK